MSKENVLESWNKLKGVQNQSDLSAAGWNDRGCFQNFFCLKCSSAFSPELPMCIFFAFFLLKYLMKTLPTPRSIFWCPQEKCIGVSIVDLIVHKYTGRIFPVLSISILCLFTIFHNFQIANKSSIPNSICCIWTQPFLLVWFSLTNLFPDLLGCHSFYLLHTLITDHLPVNQGITSIYSHANTYYLVPRMSDLEA